MASFVFSFDSLVGTSIKYQVRSCFKFQLRINCFRIKSHLPSQIYDFNPSEEGLKKIYYGNVDGKEFNELTLKSHLLNLIGQILGERGMIFYAQGIRKDRSEHFKVTKPTWFHNMQRDGNLE